MTDAPDRQLFIYSDSNQTDWQEFRPGTQRKVLHEDPATGQLTMLVQWDADTGWASLSSMDTTNTCIS